MRQTLTLTIIVALVAGCATARAIHSDERAQYVAASKVFTATVDGLASLRSQGRFSVQQGDQITVAIAQGREFLDAWHDDLIAGRPRTGALAQFNAILAQLQAHTEGK